MGLNKGPFVVDQSVSVDDPYDRNDPDVISIPTPGDSEEVLTVDVCVKQPHKTQVLLDSMVQVAVRATLSPFPVNVTFVVEYELERNGTTIASITNEMDYLAVGSTPGVNGRHNNFPNFPLVDENPNQGNNTYVLRCTNFSPNPSPFITIGSRSLKASLFEC
ncbi:hypothetical protein [Chengkuizengella axinellae]|uniref:DUF4489 domain-containing protein n=1 Tax=Chengkuizengella axinellae TaxID=3064388 RepID=A0ABT9IYZ3_9BACL|nr:hypothetical protein [Chengkuizengella sp. 2205SS18-9]MDP5274019.1 hypothetical protein [Chengkuizengella sp. 2205SS18-9]